MGLGPHLTWDGALQDMASEYILCEGWPVVILIHYNDLQVRGVLQGRATQVQGKGSQLNKEKARASSEAPRATQKEQQGPMGSTQEHMYVVRCGHATFP